MHEMVSRKKRWQNNWEPERQKILTETKNNSNVSNHVDNNRKQLLGDNINAKKMLEARWKITNKKIKSDQWRHCWSELRKIMWLKITTPLKEWYDQY